MIKEKLNISEQETQELREEIEGLEKRLDASSGGISNKFEQVDKKLDEKLDKPPEEIHVWDLF